MSWKLSTSTKSMVKIECIEPMLDPTSCASSRMVGWRFCMTKFCFWSITRTFQLIESLSINVQLYLISVPLLNLCDAYVIIAERLMNRSFGFHLDITKLDLILLLRSLFCHFAENKNPSGFEYIPSFTDWIPVTWTLCELEKITCVYPKEIISHASFVFTEKFRSNTFWINLIFDQLNIRWWSSLSTLNRNSCLWTILYCFRVLKVCTTRKVCIILFTDSYDLYLNRINQTFIVKLLKTFQSTQNIYFKYEFCICGHNI